MDYFLSLFLVLPTLFRCLYLVRCSWISLKKRFVGYVDVRTVGSTSFQGCVFSVSILFCFDF